ncbi:MAG: DNA-processing protein DprA [Candidatus Symbiothrix sp.]|jgi:DNA processing protein|nr:DNA-processing protein DprA [Candidatus Symbiothrix sp.]
MTDQNLLYQIGITLVKGIGTITTKQVLDALGDVSLLFKEKRQVLERIPGISHKVITEIRKPEILQRAEEEIRFIEKNKIEPLFIRSEGYPRRLLDCVDAPVMLYFRGTADLNAAKIISIVGTRHATSYGKEITDALIHDMAQTYPNIVIVSGLAYGIDIFAHRAALKYDLPTIGVLAHGLDRIYPYEHRNIAKDMLEKGGILTDYISQTTPDRPNFVKRNRIIAGLSDCTLVVESAEKGGSLITADIADSYNRDVFAVPGKTTDTYSAGCNLLIKYKKAALVSSAADIFREMCWDESSKPTTVQREIFIELSPEEQQIVDLLREHNDMQLNTIVVKTNQAISQLTPRLFEMEMKGVIRCFPGGVYRLA